MSLWPPGEAAGLWGEARASLPWLCGCRWLMHTPVSSAASHLSGQDRQTGFYQETQVSRKTIKEVWIEQILHPSRKQNCIQIFSKLSSDKSSGHQMPGACLWEDLPSCSPTEVQHEGAGLPASLTGLMAHFGKESPLKGSFPTPQHCWACELLHTCGYLVF